MFATGNERNLGSMSERTLLVTGASGHLGRRVVELLLDAGERHVIATTREPAKLDDLAARGVDVRRADFDRPETLDAAFQGATRVLLVSTDALDRPGRRLTQHRAAVDAAKRAGARHVVYTSLVEPGEDSPVLLAPDHRETEAALAASGLGFTVLRNGLYAELLADALGPALATGVLSNAQGEGRVAYVTREDCARAAAAALVASFEGRRTLDVTGPEAVSQADVARVASRVAGRAVRYEPLSTSAFADVLVGVGLPRPVADVYASFDTASAAGRFARVSPAFEELTGARPTSVEAFLSGALAGPEGAAEARPA